jgi:hypothetical protein
MVKFHSHKKSFWKKIHISYCCTWYCLKEFHITCAAFVRYNCHCNRMILKSYLQLNYCCIKQCHKIIIILNPFKKMLDSASGFKKGLHNYIKLPETMLYTMYWSCSNEEFHSLKRAFFYTIPDRNCLVKIIYIQ